MQTMILVGAEEAGRAASRMESAASEMGRAASSIEYAFDQQRRFLDDWLTRLEEVLAKD